MIIYQSLSCFSNIKTIHAFDGTNKKGIRQPTFMLILLSADVTHVIVSIIAKIVNEYDQEIPQS